MYEFSSHFSIAVTIEDGKLWIQPTGQERSRIYAESDTTFYSRALPVELTFVTDESGDVTGAVMLLGGREVTGRTVSE